MHSVQKWIPAGHKMSLSSPCIPEEGKGFWCLEVERDVAAPTNEAAGPFSCLPQRFAFVYLEVRSRRVPMLLSPCHGLGAGSAGQSHQGKGGFSGVCPCHSRLWERTGAAQQHNPATLQYSGSFVC